MFRVKWMLNKWNEKKKIWCEMLKRKNENVENGEGVKFIVDGFNFKNYMIMYKCWWFYDYV